MNQGDYYQILGIDRKANPQTIKQAYRRLAFQYHPDRNKETPATVEKMKEVNEAYAVLSDPRKRRDYDTLRERYGPMGFDRFKQSYSEEDIFRGSDIIQIFEEMARAFGVRGFEEVFKESYGPGYHTFEFRRPGIFGQGFIFFGPGYRRGDQAAGPAPSVMLPGNLGALAEYLLRKMLGIRETRGGKDWHEPLTLDSRQAQEGGKIRYFHRRRSKELVVTIPPGIRPGQKIRLKAMGAFGKDGDEPGDLYLKVEIKKPFLQKVKDLLQI